MKRIRFGWPALLLAACSSTSIETAETMLWPADSVQIQPDPWSVARDSGAAAPLGDLHLSVADSTILIEGNFLRRKSCDGIFPIAYAYRGALTINVLYPPKSGPAMNCQDLTVPSWFVIRAGFPVRAGQEYHVTVLDQRASTNPRLDARVQVR